MTTPILIAACVVIVSAAIIVACIDAVIVVYSVKADRWLRRLCWYWNALQWKISDAMFYARVWLINKKAGF